jgi:acyl-CoA thioesterase FadM
MSHHMTAVPERRLAGDVHTVLVTYDYQSARPVPVPDEWREKIGRYEQRPFEADAPRPNAAAAS